MALVEIKSDWWRKTGHNSVFTGRTACIEQAKKGVGQHHLVRVAVKGLVQNIRVPEVVELFPACYRAEMVYKHNGRLSLLVMTFRTVAQRNATLKAYNGNERVQVHPVYSCRTGDSARARVCTHQILPRVCGNSQGLMVHSSSNGQQQE